LGSLEERWAAMNNAIKKIIRTAQSELYFLKDAKDVFYYHSRRFLARPHEWEFKALRFIPDCLPGCYLDVGANYGQSIESIKVVKSAARIWSFEPNPLLATRLQHRYRDRADITVLAYGLGEKDDAVPLIIPVYKGFVYDGLASFNRKDAAGWLCPDTLYCFNPEKLELRETVCVIHRLDDYLLDPLFIKIDVQGYEWHVLRGGIETIERHEPVLMVEEFHKNKDFVDIVTNLKYEEYFFDETGFYRADIPDSRNAFLMTPSRFRTVKQSQNIYR
jgi:FkbM family methyltransferase